MTDRRLFHRASFSKSAQHLGQCPADEGFEVAFAGRSNAGKSSAINTLTGNRKLARTSKTPGRTQLINFFDLSPTQRLVDLPGYGYAKVPPEVKEKWQRDLGHYLQHRAALKGLILLMDVRHPLTDYDQQMITWCVEVEMPVHLLLTKADKLKRGAQQQTLLGVRRAIKEEGLDQVSVQLFSALKGTGLDELVSVLLSWLEPQEPTATAEEPAD